VKKILAVLVVIGIVLTGLKQGAGATEYQTAVSMWKDGSFALGHEQFRTASDEFASRLEGRVSPTCGPSRSATPPSRRRPMPSNLRSSSSRDRSTVDPSWRTRPEANLSCGSNEGPVSMSLAVAGCTQACASKRRR
jgi:hypothetical protein